MKNLPLQISKITFAILGVLLFTKVSPAESVKADPLAAKGCIAKVSVEAAKAAMTRFNLHQLNARPSEIQTLGTALVFIEKLNGGKPPEEAVGEENGYRFNFRNGMGASRQTPGEIQVTRNGVKRNGNNVAQLVHELGHYIGNHGGYKDYCDTIGARWQTNSKGKGRCRAPLAKYCTVSGYSDDRFNEQFAEVFAAFVTRPEKIKENSSPACKTAFRFFANYFDGRAVDLVTRCMARQEQSQEQSQRL